MSPADISFGADSLVQPDVFVEREALRWHPDGATAPFTLPLDELFRPI